MSSLQQRTVSGGAVIKAAPLPDFLPGAGEGRRRFLLALGAALLIEAAGVLALGLRPPTVDAGAAAPQVIKISAVTLPPPLPPLTPVQTVTPPTPAPPTPTPEVAPKPEATAAVPPPAAEPEVPQPEAETAAVPPAPAPSPIVAAPPPPPPQVTEAKKAPQKPLPHRKPPSPRPVKTAEAEPPKPPAPSAAPAAPSAPAAPAAPAVSAAQAADALSRYAADLRARVQRTLVVPASIQSLGLSGESEVRITLAPDGQLIDVSLARSSGAPLIDRLALSTVKATHFAPFPPELPPHPVTFALRVVIGE